MILKGTNKAIEKVASLALYFQDQGDCKIALKTGSVATVDDIVEKEDAGAEKEDAENEEDVEELPEIRVRWLSVLEAHITLK